MERSRYEVSVGVVITISDVTWQQRMCRAVQVRAPRDIFEFGMTKRRYLEFADLRFTLIQGEKDKWGYVCCIVLNTY